jgi:hypothetical protein
VIWDPITNFGLDAVKAGLRKARVGLSKKRYRQLVAAAVAELLVEVPDLALAEANLLAAQALGEPPAPELLRAQAMLKSAKAFGTGVTKKKRSAGGIAKKKSKAAAPLKGKTTRGGALHKRTAPTLRHR